MSTNTRTNNYHKKKNNYSKNKYQGNPRQNSNYKTNTNFYPSNNSNTNTNTNFYPKKKKYKKFYNHKYQNNPTETQQDYSYPTNDYNDYNDNLFAEETQNLKEDSQVESEIIKMGEMNIAKKIEIISKRDFINLVKTTLFSEKMVYVLTDCISKVIDVNYKCAYDFANYTTFFSVTILPFLQPKEININYLTFIENLLSISITFQQKSFNNLRISYDEINSTADIISKGMNFIENKNKTLLDKLYIISNKKILLDKLRADALFNAENDDSLSYAQKNEMKSVPIDYRTHKVEITDLEILTDFEKKILPHISKGRYVSFPRYLNTMFYLEYEDCYRSVRRAIFNIYNDKQTENEISDWNIEKENTDIYYYHKASIVSVNISRDGVLVTLNFKSPRKVLKFTKRMIYGNLLFITDEKFSSFLLGTVEYNPYSMRGIGPKRKIFIPKDESTYVIQILLCNPEIKSFEFLQENMSNTNLQIFESKAYFEAYVHIMNRLKELDPYNLPFKDVLIDGNFDSMFPDYLSNIKTIYPSQYSTLDESQRRAFEMGLKMKVCLIQGPPGTGKTHVSSMLTGWLMRYSHSPILVVCYTNHALDQFLEKLLPYTQSIIRIGGRCNNDKIKGFVYQGCNRKDAITVKIKSINKEIYKFQRILSSCLSTLNKEKFTSLKIIFYFNEFSEKILSDFRDMLKLTEDNLNDIEEILAKAWAGEMNLEELYAKLPFKTNKVDFIMSFIEFQDNNPIKVSDNNEEPNNESKQQVENNQEEEIYEDDEEELDETYNRLALQGEYGEEEEEGEEEEDINLGEEEKNMMENDKVLGDDEYQYIFSNYNLWKLGPLIRKRILLYLKLNIIKYQNQGTVFDQRIVDTFQQLIKRRKELKQIQDSRDILSKCRVIGMTTTGCAKNATLLERIGPEIIVIEEAAEILESHVASLLTKRTKHIIMIGDHKQLKPKPYNYEIEKKYNFDVSLFERLINNGIPFASLKYQRRMKSMFADFVRIIYGKESYNDFPGVDDRPKILGVLSDMNFITHRYDEKNITGLGSKSNYHEAEFCILLSIYFINQGYKPSQITILTFYTGQVLLMRKLSKDYNLNDVRISSVDNYQGEENDIIILSLVRSNSEGKIGFLKTFNRVCVAFSRARLGMYVVGNIDFIVGAENKIAQNKSIFRNENRGDMNNVWKQIKTKAEEKRIIHNYIDLICQTHKNVTRIGSNKDFSKVPYGGCGKLCNVPLDCGHKCNHICHNFPHEEMLCKQPCKRFLSCGHLCKKLCHETCDRYSCNVKVMKALLCGHVKEVLCKNYDLNIECNEKVIKTLLCKHEKEMLCCEDIRDVTCKEEVVRTLFCGHKKKMLCYEDINKIVCKERVLKTLLCGHKRTMSCHESIKGIICYEKVDKTLRCGHKREMFCYEDINKIVCKEKVLKTLLCGHKRTMLCHESIKGIICKEEVDKTLPCGHKKKMLCCEDINKIVCKEKVLKTLRCRHKKEMLCHESIMGIICKEMTLKTLPCGHKRKMECCESTYGIICKEMTLKTLPCGHKRNMLCCEDTKGIICNEVVDKTLPCGHKKKMLCYDEDIKRIICREKTLKTLRCGHKKEMLCYEDTKGVVCKERAMKTLSCGHEKEMLCCDSIVGVKCKEKCNRIMKCGHECDGMCGEKCDEKKCQKKAFKMLPCGHQGFYKCNVERSLCKCEIPCLKELECGHKCKGKCFECLGGTLHIPCDEKCNKVLICSHKCSRRCGEICKCDSNSIKFCSHNTGVNEPCSKAIACKENCENSCEHYSCNKLCYQICDKKKCDKRCKKILPCGSQCPGICGERCPKFCYGCIPDFAYSDNVFNIKNDKYNEKTLLYETECGHIFDLKSLDKYFEKVNENQNVVSLLTCPKCQTVLKKEKRYQHFINKRVHQVKSIVIQTKYLTENYESRNKEICIEIRNKIEKEKRESKNVLNIISEFLSSKDIQMKSSIVMFNFIMLLDTISIIEDFYNKHKKREDLLFKLFSINYEITFKAINNFLTQNQYNQAFLNRLNQKLHSIYLFVISKTINIRSFFTNKSKIINEEITGGLEDLWYVCPSDHFTYNKEKGIKSFYCFTCKKKFEIKAINPQDINKDLCIIF